MKVIVIGTRNAGKIREIVRLWSDLPVHLLTLENFPDLPSIVEDGTTFHENARKKAVEIARWTGFWALGEDSGLEVDALGGAPGVYSARYSGEKATDASNNLKLIATLQGIPPERRQARYRAVAVMAGSGKIIAEAEGVCEGTIVDVSLGSGGFGYDPHFVPQAAPGRTMAELGLDEKNRISHRAQAMTRLRESLLRVLDSRKG